MDEGNCIESLENRTKYNSKWKNIYIQKEKKKQGNNLEIEKPKHNQTKNKEKNRNNS